MSCDVGTRSDVRGTLDLYDASRDEEYLDKVDNRDTTRIGAGVHTFCMEAPTPLVPSRLISFAGRSVEPSARP